MVLKKVNAKRKIKRRLINYLSKLEVIDFSESCAYFSSKYPLPFIPTDLFKSMRYSYNIFI